MDSPCASSDLMDVEGEISIECRPDLPFVLVIASTQQAALPHVSECNFCMHCSSDDTGMQQPSMEPMSRDMFSKIYPTDEEIKAKGLKPNCTECRGCSTQLQPLKAVMAFGQDFSVEVGGSPEWIFTTGEWRGL